MFVIHQPAHRPRGRTALVATAGGPWALVRIRLRDRLLVRWRELALDTQLADGRRPEDDRLLAVRASMLSAPHERHELTVAWEQVFGAPARSGRSVDSRVAVRRSCVLAAEDDVRHLISLLRSSTPVSARGLAIANLLLTDGTGPLYHSRSPADLGATVREAIRHLDPLTDLSA